MNNNFNKMNISNELKKGIKDLGFTEATDIQAKAIPEILTGIDVIGQAQTGTGKTAAFAIPALEKIDPFSFETQSIVVCPTRELAIQVAKEFKKLSKHMNRLNIVAIYGGESIRRQQKQLNSGAQIIIGTPGRIMDHMNRGNMILDCVETVILDEADEMLNMGFRDDIETILKETPKHRQTVLFSATMPNAIKNIAKKYQKNHHVIKTNQKSLVANKVEQFYLKVRGKKKFDALQRFLLAENYRLSLVFSNTKRMADELSDFLQSKGFKADALHGDMSQAQRDRVMNKFRNGDLKILIATDVAARGLDVNEVDLVFNFDTPQNVEYYIHRIGRTGRAGKKGRAITFDGNRHKKTISKIKRFKPSKIKIPSDKDIMVAQEKMIIDETKKLIDNTDDLSAEIKIVKKLMQNSELSAVEIAASLLSTLKNNNSTTDATSSKDLMNKFENSGGESGMVRIFVNIGKQRRVKARDFVGAIASEAKIPGSCIGAIDILNNFSFVEVPFEYGKKVLDTMNNNTIKGHKIVMEVANAR